MPNANVISFNDAVIQLQRLNKTASNQEKYARDDSMVQKIMVGIEARGDQGEQRQEEIESKQEKHQSKMEQSLNDIRNIMSDISKTINVALASSIGGSGTGSGSNAGSVLARGTELTETQQEESKAKADADKEQHVLLNKLIEGISGLKKATDDGLGKLGQTFKEGSGGGGGIMGGISSLLGAGKGLVSGGIKGVGGKIAGAARGGLGMISRAGPLAGVAGLGLAGFNVVNDVMGNIDKSNEVEANVKSGALTRDQGNVLQGESMGSTAGTAAGAAIGGIAGSALGPLGTAAGMWLGSKVGGFAGGVAGKYGVKAYQGIKGMLGFGESEKEKEAKLSPEQKNMQDMASGKIDMDEYNKRMKLQVEGGAAPPAPLPTSATATQSPSGAKTTGMWDSMKSMGASAMGGIKSVGASAIGGIKSGAEWVGNKATAAGAAIAGGASWLGNKASSIGSAIAGKASKFGEDAGESLLRAKNKVGDVGYMATENTKNFIDRNTGGALTKTGNAISSAKNSVLGMFGMSDKVIDNGDGSKTTVKSDGSKIVQDGGGTKTYDKSGKLISEKSPTFAGASTETRADGSKVQSYDMGPMSGKVETTAAGGQQTTASYDLGVTKVAMRETLTPKQMREREIGAKMEAGLPNKIPLDGGTTPAAAPAASSSEPSAPSAPKRGGQSVIAGEPWAAGQKLSDKQLAAIESGIASGTSYSMRLMSQYDKQKGNATAAVTGGAQSGVDGDSARGGQIYSKSAETASAREDVANKSSAGTAVVNAPTTVNNTTQQSSVIRSPIRNEENSLNRYYGSRMGVY